MLKAGIAGSTGYTGAELIKLILGHPKVELSVVTSKSYKGKAIADIFPGFRSAGNLTCEALDIERISDRVDVMFLALPHQVSMAWVPQLLDKGIKVVDLSADFRFKDAAIYETVYQEHTSRALLEKAVYGLSEIYREEIQTTDLVGNPGCYPTSILLPLIPLIKEKVILPAGIISDSKSGVSGAGRSVSLGTHFCEVNEGFKPYKVEGHRHTPEIEAILSEKGNQDIRITFIPHLLPLTRGMLSTIYVQVPEHVSEASIREILDVTYKNEPFVRVLPKGAYPNIAHVRNTNCCDIGLHYDQHSRRLIVIAAIDNLLKGAAGQAVQNMNIMFGFDQTLGLTIGQGVL